MRFMKKNKHTNAYFISGAAITVLFIILMLIGLIHTPYDPNAMNGAEKFSSPSFSHIMGTDNFGRDIFSRALGILFIPSFARIVRSEYISLKERDFVKSARLMGAGNMRIIFRHIFPNIRSTLFVTVTIGFNNAVLAEAGLSYLGIGIQPPDASLGSMLSDAQSYLFTAPWYAIMPGMTIVLFVLGFSLLAEGIRIEAEREQN